MPRPAEAFPLPSKPAPADRPLPSAEEIEAIGIQHLVELYQLDSHRPAFEEETLEEFDEVMELIIGRPATRWHKALPGRLPAWWRLDLPQTKALFERFKTNEIFRRAVRAEARRREMR